MKFEAYTRRQTELLLERISGHVAGAAKAELEALRAEVDDRLTSLEESLTPPEHAALLDELVQELTAAGRSQADAARTEAETAAARTLLKAQEVADLTLENARAELQAKLSAEQAEGARLRAGLDDARQQLQTVQASAQVEVRRTRTELEAKLEQVQAARAELARVLVDTQRDATAQGLALKDARARVHALEQERTGLLLVRDEAVARAEAEGRRAQELADALATGRQEHSQAKQEARLAKADAEGRRQALEAATDQVRAVEEQLAASHAGLPVSTVALNSGGEGALTPLEDVGDALRSIDAATSASELFETLIEHLGRRFARAAVFLVGPSSFRGWRGTGLGSGSDISTIEIPRTIDSLLMRAVTERQASPVAGQTNGPAVGVLGSPASSALALPVFANGRVIAVAYAEHADESSAPLLALGSAFAGILIDRANQRLTVKTRESAASSASSGTPAVDRLRVKPEAAAGSFSPARQADRTPMKAGVEITIEGSPGTLVDVSTLGAQVLSPVAMRPKRIVRVAFSTEEGVVVCRGRVIWAQFEQATGKTEARYRAGVKFTEADVQALDTFLAHHGGRSPRQRGRLEETA